MSANLPCTCVQTGGAQCSVHGRDAGVPADPAASNPETIARLRRLDAERGRSAD